MGGARCTVHTGGMIGKGPESYHGDIRASVAFYVAAGRGLG